MNTAGDYPRWPYDGNAFWQWPHPAFPTYAPMPSYGDGCRPLMPIDEQKVREIIREELQKALAALKSTENQE